MTTIAFKDGIMAADSQCTLGSNIISADISKLWRHMGCVYGFSGSTLAIERVKKEIRQQETGQNPEPLEHPDSEDVYWLKYQPDTTNYTPNLSVGHISSKGDLSYVVIPRGYHAIGSGGDLATGAMMAGSSAKEAVEIACKVDVYSGGEVTCMSGK